MGEQETKVIEIDADLHRRAKARAALAGMTLRAFIEEAIRQVFEYADSQKEGL